MAQEATAVYNVHADIGGGGVKTRTWPEQLNFSNILYLCESLCWDWNWNIIKIVAKPTQLDTCVFIPAVELQHKVYKEVRDRLTRHRMWREKRHATRRAWKRPETAALRPGEGQSRNDSCSIQSGVDVVFGWFLQASFPVIYKTHSVCFSIRLRQKENMQLNMSLLWLGRGLGKY